MAEEEAIARLGREALPLLDWLNCMVIHNLKMLRDPKAPPITLTVQNFGQVNVSQQQGNVPQATMCSESSSCSAEQPGSRTTHGRRQQLMRVCVRPPRATEEYTLGSEWQANTAGRPGRE